MTRRTGLTLIELLAAMAIMTLLLGATLTVIGAIGRAERHDARRHEARFGPERLREILTIDIEHARRCRVDGSGVELQTLARLRSDDLELEHVPATVQYEIALVGETHWLIRVQRDAATDAGHSQGTHRELLCPGVRSIALRSAGSTKALPAGRWRSVPRAVTVTVEFEDDATEPAEFTFRVRESL
jgi:prepilin-type N-terminal cleavage/methylation domain-containing protein